MVRRLALLVVFAMVLGAAFVAGAAIAAPDSEVIYACVHSGNGKNLRIVEGRDDCRNNEELVYWNVEGPAGPAGTVDFYTEISRNLTIPANSALADDVFCDTGDYAIGFGGPLQDPAGDVVMQSAAHQGNYYRFFFRNLSDDPVTLTFAGEVICADLTP